jgi:hypothetical protein
MKYRRRIYYSAEQPVETAAGSRPYELALNSSFSGHNYTFREKRFELWPKRHGREKLPKSLQLS